jgi:hypothetical protein
VTALRVKGHDGAVDTLFYEKPDQVKVVRSLCRFPADERLPAAAPR